mmetsp:Transcript_11473/g.21455  ORF Transcript_11473/g.21455 Transcript_11473/m.21455 type:complete len:160 (-) Transcript_11473:537-1016(-)
MFYLTEKDFSPRFDDTFFTCSIMTRHLLEKPPQSSTESTTRNDDSMSKSRHHIAIYYEIRVKCGHKNHIVHRRYSEFRNLLDELKRNPPHPSEREFLSQVHVPPKTCFFSKVDYEFLDNRQEELEIFLEHLLKRPNYAIHPAIRKFLKLDSFQKSAEKK